MQDHGQLLLLREFELRFVKQQLLGQGFGRIEFWHKTVKTYFTHRH